jgi:hypothetical protein
MENPMISKRQNKQTPLRWPEIANKDKVLGNSKPFDVLPATFRNLNDDKLNIKLGVNMPRQTTCCLS